MRVGSRPSVEALGGPVQARVTQLDNSNQFQFWSRGHYLTFRLPRWTPLVDLEPHLRAAVAEIR